MSRIKAIDFTSRHLVDQPWYDPPQGPIFNRLGFSQLVESFIQFRDCSSISSEVSDGNQIALLPTGRLARLIRKRKLGSS